VVKWNRRENQQSAALLPPPQVWPNGIHKSIFEVDLRPPQRHDRANVWANKRLLKRSGQNLWKEGHDPDKLNTQKLRFSASSQVSQ